MTESLNSIQTKRLMLRPLTLKDAESVFAYARDPEVTRFLSWNPHRNVEDSIKMIEWAEENYRKGINAPLAMIRKSDQRLMGTVDIAPRTRFHPKCGMLAYAMGRAYWGHGYMTEAVEALLRYGFTELGFRLIQSEAVEENNASWKVMERVGMVREGCLRSAYLLHGTHEVNLLLYSIHLNEWRLRHGT